MHLDKYKLNITCKYLIDFITIEIEASQKLLNNEDGLDIWNGKPSALWSSLAHFNLAVDSKLEFTNK